MERILVIGGAGFLAGHLVPVLLNLGHEVTVMDVVPPDGATRLAAVRDKIRYWWKSGLDLEHVGEADVVLYLAAQADVPLGISSPTYTFQQNVLSVLRYMEVIRPVRPAPRTIYMSSESVYGVIPAERQPITEDVLPNPTNVYAVSKLCAESIVRAYAAQYELPAVVLRSTTMYGEASRSKQVIPIFIRQALANEPITVEGDGSQTRDFNYVGNVVSAIRAAIRHPHVTGTYNIGSGVEVSIRQVAETIVQLTGSQSEVKFGPWRPGEKGVKLNISTERARRDFGYVPEFTMNEGLQRTIDYWRTRA